MVVRDNWHRLEDLQTEQKALYWFRIKGNPAPLPLKDGSLRFSPLHIEKTNFDAAAVLEDWDKNLFNTWKEKGSVVNGVFEWWFTASCSLGDLMQEEFDMMRYHQSREEDPAGHY